MYHSLKVEGYIFHEDKHIVVVDSTKSGYQKLAECYKLSPEQITQLQTYADLLATWNERMNLTALDEPEDILHYHFKDSLEISRFYPMDQVTMMADVGTGAGFPAIPLKIMYPHMQVVLIEVLNKRISFLQEVIRVLGLQNIEVVPLDWRTFLRSTSYPLDLCIARASLAPAELMRMFKSHHYKQARLVYWASEQWQPDASMADYLYERHYYEVGDRKRQYAFFRKRT